MSVSAQRRTSGPAVARQARQSFGNGSRAHRPDYWLVVAALLLVSVGLVIIYSISPALKEFRGGNFVTRQIVAIGLSMIAFAVTSRIPLALLRQFRWTLLGIAALGTLLALVTPVVPEYPQHRWIRFGALSLQSVEILKFALLIVVSSFLAERVRDGSINDFQKTFKPLGIGLGVVGLVIAFVQSDLGSMGVLVAMLGVMLFMAGMKPRYLLMILGLFRMFFPQIQKTEFKNNPSVFIVELLLILVGAFLTFKAYFPIKK